MAPDDGTLMRIRAVLRIGDVGWIHLTPLADGQGLIVFAGAVPATIQQRLLSVPELHGAEHLPRR